MKVLALVTLAACGRIGFDARGEAAAGDGAVAVGRCGAVPESTNVMEIDVGPGAFGDVTLPTCADNELFAVFTFATACTLHVLVTGAFDSAINVVGQRCIDNPGASGEQLSIAGNADQVTVLAIEGCGDVRLVYGT